MSTFIVTTLDDSGSGSLRQAILDANATSSDDLITFDPLLSGQTITLTSDELFISDGVVIDGDLDNNGTPDITIQRDATANPFRIFNIDDGIIVLDSYLNPVTLEGVIITGGSAESDDGSFPSFGSSVGRGGGIFTLEDLTIKNSIITGNSAVSGGGIYAFDNDYEISPVVSISNSVISNNVANDLDGGGRFRSQFIGAGGGILGGALTVTNSTVSDNAAAGLGGGIITRRAGRAEIDNSVISNNTAGSGGGIAIDYAGTLTTNNSTISNNSATSDGGGIHIDIQAFFASRSYGESNVTLNDSVISGNTANGRGGGISNTGAELTINSSTVSDNSTMGNGGGIFVSDSRAYDSAIPGYASYGSLTVSDTTISGNSTQGSDSDGGGIYSSAVDVAVTNSTISGNATQGANSNGGGLHSTSREGYASPFDYDLITLSGTLTITNSTVSNNTTNGFGGGINSDAYSELTLNNSTVTGNTAPDGQGSGVAVYATASTYEYFYRYYDDIFSASSSIIAGNGNSDIDFRDVNPSVLGGNNLIGTSNDLSAFTQPSNITGILEPGLEPLADNGGPTQTHALQTDSLAIDAGSNPNSLVTDQRGTGFARVINDQTDIGAFEVQSSVPTLTLTIDPTSISENGGTATATVIRNTDTEEALTVLLSSSDPGEASVPNDVVIPVGQVSATFQVLGVDDAIADGTKTPTLTASTTGFTDGTTALDVTDDEVATLTLTIDPTSISENGGMATATVTRNTDTEEALTVLLSSSDLSEAALPDDVVIPVGQASTTFQILGVDDGTVDGPQTPTITAAATGFVDDTGILEVTDDEVATLTLTIDPTSISENGGTATATVTRNTDTTTALTVLLSSSDLGEAAVPESVLIPAGQAAATFQVLGVDDEIVDETQTSTITATADNLLDGIATIDITDDDAPNTNGFFFSADDDSSVGSLTVADEDIIQFDGTTFSLFFDGSDVLNTNIEIDAFDIIDANTILMSFDQKTQVSGVGAVDDSDIVQFTATSLGAGNTAGTFAMYLDGSALGLTKNSEDIDALIGMPDGSLLFSTTGNATLPNGLKSKDEDLLRFDAASGDTSLYFDGSDVGLTKGPEDINAVGIHEDQLLLSTTGNFVVPGLSGKDEDAFSFTPTSTGNTTTGNFGNDLIFDGSQFGFTGDLSGFDFNIG